LTITAQDRRGENYSNTRGQLESTGFRSVSIHCACQLVTTQYTNRMSSTVTYTFTITVRDRQMWLPCAGASARSSFWNWEWRISVLYAENDAFDSHSYKNKV